jgi:hypothetical protein
MPTFILKKISRDGLAHLLMMPPGANRGGTRMRAELDTKPRRAELYLFLLFCLQGCVASQTEITLEPGASLSNYHVLDVETVTNDTGQTFSFDVSGFFTDELESALRTKGYEIAEQGKAPAKALLVKCSIVSYSPGTAGKKVAAEGLGLLPGGIFLIPKDTTTVKATLIDQQTGKTMAEIITNQSETESGVLPPVSVGYGHGISLISSQKLVLMDAASGIASRIDAKIK